MVPANGASVHVEVIEGITGEPLRIIRPVDERAFEQELLADGAYEYDRFQDAVRSAVDRRFNERHADLLKTNARQLQKLVEFDALKAAFDSIVKQKTDYATFAEEAIKRCEALLALYPADVLKQNSAGGAALREIYDLVRQAKTLKGGKDKKP